MMGMEPKRVLQVLGSLNRGGAETFIMNVYRSINKEKMQFDFIVHCQEDGDFSDEIISMGGKIYKCPKYTGKNHFLYVMWWKKFFSEHSEYDIIHSHVRSTASIYFPIAKKNNITTIIHSHSTSNGKGLASIVKKIFQDKLKRCTDYFFACSKESGEWLYGSNIVNGEKYFYIPNAIDLANFSFDKFMREKYRKELNVGDKIVYIHIGRFSGVKNHKFLVDVFNALHRVQPDSVLLLVGLGELFDQTKDYIDCIGLSESVYMLGKRTDVNYLYSASDCLLFPSLWEGLPVTVIEAQSSGIPCFISNTISNDINISDLVHMLPINNGTQPWVDAILDSSLERKNVSVQLKNNGYDATAVADWLHSFYVNH